MEANSNGNHYVFESLTLTGAKAWPATLICYGNVHLPNTASGGTLADPHGEGVTIVCPNIDINTYGVLHAELLVR